MAGLFMPLKAPSPPVIPVAPAVADPTIQAQADEEVRKRMQAKGRASTYLTDPSEQAKPEASRARRLLGDA